MLTFGVFLFVWGTSCLQAGSSASDSVLELDDSFMERKGDNSWLVKFYAPWCGHCRRLEPVWHQVHMGMKGSDIRVAKVDATKYPSVATEYDVRGYPTIKFIQADRAITYRGDRLRDTIMEFAKRAHGPVIRWLSNVGKLHDARGDHSSGVFFLYIGPDDENDDFLKCYKEVAELYRVLSYFYAGTKQILPAEVKIKHDQTVLVIKDGKYYEYDAPKDGFTKESLEDFVNGERFFAFSKITSGGMGELAGLNKKVFMVITQSKMEDDPQQERMKQLGKMLATTFRERYHSAFLFIWMDDPETGNTITMSRPETPYIIVMEPDTQHYYLPEQGFDVAKMTIEEAHVFLKQIKDGKATAYGGTGFGQRVKRLFYDIGVTIYGIYNESPWLALLVFGVPSVVISIVCYALCCMEPIDEEAFYDELAEEARAAQADKEGLTDAEGQAVLSDDQQVRKRLVHSDKDDDTEPHVKKE